MMQDQDAGLFIGMQGGLQVGLSVCTYWAYPIVIKLGSAPRRVTGKRDANVFKGHGEPIVDSYRCQCLVEFLDQVITVFDANREANQ